MTAVARRALTLPVEPFTLTLFEREATAEVVAPWLADQSGDFVFRAGSAGELWDALQQVTAGGGEWTFRLGKARFETNAIVRADLFAKRRGYVSNVGILRAYLHGRNRG